MSKNLYYSNGRCILWYVVSNDGYFHLRKAAQSFLGNPPKPDNAYQPHCQLIRTFLFFLPELISQVFSPSNQKPLILPNIILICR